MWENVMYKHFKKINIFFVKAVTPLIMWYTALLSAHLPSCYYPLCLWMAALHQILSIASGYKWSSFPGFTITLPLLQAIWPHSTPLWIMSNSVLLFFYMMNWNLNPKNTEDDNNRLSVGSSTDLSMSQSLCFTRNDSNNTSKIELEKIK